MCGKITRILPVFLLTAIICVIGADAAFAFSSIPCSAGPCVNDITKNMVNSVDRMPGLISAIGYSLALLFGVTGIFKLREHVEGPQNTPLREPLVRFIAGGALLAIPTIYGVMQNMIGSGGVTLSSLFSTGGFLSGLASAFTLPLTTNVNEIVHNIIASVDNLPGLASAIGYMLALILGFSGVLKLKEHIESPQNTAMREGVIRLIVGGALFSLPAIFVACQKLISGSSSGSIYNVIQTVLTQVGGFLGLGGTITSCSPTSLISGYFGGLGGMIGSLWGMFGGGGGMGGSTQTIGDVICQTYMGTAALPNLFICAGYLFGIALGFWGLLKLKDHVLDPRSTPIWEPVTRLIAAGAFFALPYVMDVIHNTVGLIAPLMTSGGFSGTITGQGLDASLISLISNIYGPTMLMLNTFGYLAGTVLTMIAISRLLKSSQEGARGPGGIGTIMTFIAAACLFSLSPLVASFSGTMFGSPIVATKVMGYAGTAGGFAASTEGQHISAVISSVLQFMILLGIVSIARGVFIIRGVAEGSHQASMMAGLTHLVGGALAVNLGPLLNAVQSTLGLTAFGVNFG